MELNRDDLLRFDYRRGELPKQVKAYQDMISGRAEPFLPYICTKNNKISARKLSALIRDLLEALAVYQRADRSPPRSSSQISLYRHFLYGAMLSIQYKEDPDYTDMSRVTALSFSSSFADITDVACAPGTTAFRSGNALEESEAEVSAGLIPSLSTGFFRCMDDTCELLFDDTFQRLLPAHVFDALIKKTQNAATEQAKADETFAGRNGYDSYQDWLDAQNDDMARRAKTAGFSSVDEFISAQLDDGPESLPENERAEQEYYAKIARDIKNTSDENISRFLASLPGKDAWLRNYMTCRNLFFADDTDVSLLPKDICNAVDTWLYLNGMSAFALGDRYGLVTHRMEQFTGQLQATLHQAGRHA